MNVQPVTDLDPNLTLILVNINGEQQSQPMMKQSMSEEQVEQFIRHPEQFSHALINILQQADAQQTIITLLTSLLQKAETSPFSQGVKQCACQLMMALPASQARQLVEEQPALFARLLKCLDQNQRAQMLKHLTHQLENWKGFFARVFLSLDRFGEGKNPQDVPAGSFLMILQSSLSPHRAKQWMKHCASDLFYEDWAFFIMTLDEKSCTFVLNLSIYSLEFNLSEDGFLDCFEALAQQIAYPKLVASVLNKILDRFYRVKKFGQIVNNFNQLSLHAQICLLDAMSPTKQGQILRKHCQNLLLMAAWMDGLFSYQQEFSVRKKTVEQICDSLQEGSLTELIRMLNDQRSKVGAYFLICLSSEDLQDFVFTVPYRIRSELLSNSLVDAATPQVLKDIEENNLEQLIDIMELDMENSTIPVDASIPLSQCFEVLQQASKAPDILSTYHSFIDRIPPVLIGVLSINSDRCEVLFELAPKLSERQLQFLTCNLSNPIFSNFMENNWTFFSKDQYLAILEVLSPNKLTYFTKAKNEKLKAINSEFQNNYKKLQEEIKKVEGQSISSAYFSKLEEQANKLYLLARRPSSLDYHCLNSFLQQPHVFNAFSPQNLTTLQPTMLELQQIRNHLNSKRSLFEGPHALVSTQLSQLKERVLDEEKMVKVEDIDLTTVVYEGFWTLVREGTLPYLEISPHSQLGIIHPGQLTLLGILSNADLHLLGISPEWQSRVDRLASDIKNLQGSKEMKIEEDVNSSGNEPQKIPSFDDLWQIFISIKTPPNELSSICTNILQILSIQQLEPADLKKTCLAFGQLLLKFQHLSESNKDHLIRRMQELEGCQLSQIMELAPGLLGIELMALRSQYPLVCLQRYLLNNKNLKQAWEKFHSQKCFSLTALVEKGLVKTPADLLKLESIAKGI